jgi:cytochrome b pre-mRNA-processing protein 3
LSFLKHLFGAKKQRASVEPLYRAIVAEGRDPYWYRNGQVPDTVDGRFDMIAALVALAHLRLEAEGEAGRGPSVLLAELFIEDMEASLRQMGVGDHVVGKHVGKMMGAVGGRVGAFRAAREDGSFTEAARRNIFHEAPPGEKALADVAARLKALAAGLDRATMVDLLAGKLRP